MEINKFLIIFIIKNKNIVSKIRYSYHYNFYYINILNHKNIRIKCYDICCLNQLSKIQAAETAFIRFLFSAR